MHDKESYDALFDVEKSVIMYYTTCILYEPRRVKMNFIPIIIFVVMVLGVVGVFIWANCQVRKRNREEYERTGIMPEYNPADATEYLLKLSWEYKEKRLKNIRKYTYIESGIGCVVFGPIALGIYIGQLLQMGIENVEPMRAFVLIPLAGLVVYGIYALIKGIRMK